MGTSCKVMVEKSWGSFEMLSLEMIGNPVHHSYVSVLFTRFTR